ncbi:ADP-ribosylglycohydrolase family protein [Bailinhaonella thermotolerans]|uniref:ADP-ribosylglycohydrolase family protein n=1 Tax=Bailinhaonella thermotolerans TaxID=1070861 RepID=UPI001F5B846A|nr:ADP-ribosylglycohydrolase family protein [Bailinhaonella thermotolerans]
MDEDRAGGVLLGAACGDALGVPYEFGARLSADETPEMIGGGLGPYAPGEYSDDTQMAVCVAEVMASGGDLDAEEALDAVALNFLRWCREGAGDIGVQTGRVLNAAMAADGPPARRLREAAAGLHRVTGLSAGNGSLMRTGPVGLAALGDPVKTARVARAVSSLTHFDDLAGDACVIWCEGIRRAVTEGTLSGVRGGLELVPAERRGRWAGWLDAAEENPPWHFSPNGFVVPALQAAWSAVSRAATGRTAGARGLRAAVEDAVRAGHDTDTVAAIAGALAGAYWGAGDVPREWREAVHGWPGVRGDELAGMGVRAAGG